MNLKALIKSLLLRKLATGLLLLQLIISVGLLVNTLQLSSDTRAQIKRDVGINIDDFHIVKIDEVSLDLHDFSYYESMAAEDMHHLSQITGVATVLPINQLPFAVFGNQGDISTRERVGGEVVRVNWVAAVRSDHRVLSVLGLDLVAGRDFLPEDRKNTAYVSNGWRTQPNIIVTESLARALFPNSDDAVSYAVGQSTSRGRIIGVAHDWRIRPTRQGNQQFFAYIHNSVSPGPAQIYLLKVPPEAVESAKNDFERMSFEWLSGRVVDFAAPLNEIMPYIYQRERGLADLFLLLSGLMIVVTLVGSFSHAQFHANQQRKVVGIRRALGAKRKHILLYVFSECWLISGTAAVFGIVAVYGINIMLNSLTELNKPDITVFALAITGVLLAATIATLLPAWQTTKIPPVLATKTL